MGVKGTSDQIQIKVMMPDPNQEPPASPNVLKGHGCSLHLDNQDRAKIWKIGASQTIDYIKIKIKMAKFSQEPPASSKPLNQDLKDMDVICTFKIQTESQN